KVGAIVEQLTAAQGQGTFGGKRTGGLPFIALEVAIRHRYGRRFAPLIDAAAKRAGQIAKNVDILQAQGAADIEAAAKAAARLGAAAFGLVILDRAGGDTQRTKGE